MNRQNPPLTRRHLAELHGVVVEEGVGGQLQVLGGRSLAHASGVVIMGAVARAEVAAVVARVGLRDAAEVRANTDANQPLRALAAVSISGRVAHGGGNDIILPGSCNLLRSALADEDRLRTPLHSEVLPQSDWSQVDLNDTGRKHILGRPECQDELSGNRPDQRGCDHSTRGGHEVHEGTAIRMANGKAVGSEVERSCRHCGCGHWSMLCIANGTEVLWGELGNGHDCRLLGILPHVRAGQCCSRGKLTLGEVRLPGESWLTDCVVVVVPQLSHANKLVRIAGGLAELRGVVHCRGPDGFLEVLFVLLWGLVQELVLVRGFFGRGGHLIIVQHQVKVHRMSKASGLQPICRDLGPRPESRRGTDEEPRQHLESQGCGTSKQSCEGSG